MKSTDQTNFERTQKLIMDNSILGAFVKPKAKRKKKLKLKPLVCFPSNAKTVIETIDGIKVVFKIHDGLKKVESVILKQYHDNIFYNAWFKKNRLALETKTV